MLNRHIIAGVILGSAVFISPAAFAQSASECEAGITEVNELIASKTANEAPGDNASLDEARSMSQEAQSAHDGGDFGRCMELVNGAKSALEG